MNNIPNIYTTYNSKFKIVFKYKGKVMYGGTHNTLEEAQVKLAELNKKYPRKVYDKFL